MLLPILLSLLSGHHATPAPAVSVQGSGGGGTNSGHGHYDLPEKAKELISRLTRENPPEVVLGVVDGKLTAHSNDFTQDELEMIAFLLSEL